MIGIGNFKAADCAGIGRRSFLKTAAAIPFTLGSTNQVMEAAQAAQKSGKVKSVILLWLCGGPSHIDTFDPKPDALRWNIEGLLEQSQPKPRVCISLN